MISTWQKDQSEASIPTESSIINAPLQRPLQANEDLPQLSLGTSDYVYKQQGGHMGLKRRKSANESYSILGFLSRKVKGARQRIFSEDVMELEASYKQFGFNDRQHS